MIDRLEGEVAAVSYSPTHAFSKANAPQILLVEGIGVEGDTHAGRTVQHLSRIAKDPDQPNLRQVHLIHAELHEELAGAGFTLRPGEMGENITTRGVDLLALPRGARLHLGPDAIVEVTGLRNPCAQLDQLHPGLMAAVLGRDESGALVRKAGIMGTVAAGGVVRVGDQVRVELPAPPFEKLDRV